ncbi:MAG: TldD/PmbA family protein [Erysipelotrichales bacterium]|nr:TldD/PmbA family protein [Erysipelotrichales bacterium]
MKYSLLFEMAKASGIDALEVYEQTNTQRNIQIFESKVDTYQDSSITGINIRGKYNGKIGNTFVELYDEGMNEKILKHIIDNASSISSTDDVPFLSEVQEYQEMELFNEELANTSTKEIIDLLLSLENKILAGDPRIDQVTDCVYTYGDSKVVIMNSHGIKAERHANYAYILVGTLAKENEDVQSDYQITIMKKKEDYQEDVLVEKALKEVLSKLNAKSMKSGSYKTIIRNDAMSSLLDVLSNSFSADSVQKGLSVLKDKMEQKIVSEKITVVDDPFRSDLIGSSTFDDEGTASCKLSMIENGVLKNFYHNLKTAKKASTVSNGHGYRSGYASPVSISPTNLYIQAGETSFIYLVKQCENGVLITDVSGLHAGFNQLTLDFSLQASGFMIENGSVARPVNLITISGNLLDILSHVEALGNDLKFNSSAVGSPSILFTAINVSGE